MPATRPRPPLVRQSIADIVLNRARWQLVMVRDDLTPAEAWRAAEAIDQALEQLAMARAVLAGQEATK